MPAILRIIATASLGSGLLGASPAYAGEDMAGLSPLTISGNAALVSDYRFRGISQTGGDPALQGSLAIAHESGVYAGAWASTVDFGKFGAAADSAYGNVELDLYAGWAGDLAPGLKADAGLLYYAYPDGNSGNPEFFEPYVSLSTTLGLAQFRWGLNYAWKQPALGGSDNVYTHANLDVGIPTTPLTASAHIGYSDGALAPGIQAGGRDRTGLDYSLGLSASMMGVSLGLSYVGVQGPSVKGITDDTVIATLSFGF